VIAASSEHLGRADVRALARGEHAQPRILRPNHLVERMHRVPPGVLTGLAAPPYSIRMGRTAAKRAAVAALLASTLGFTFAAYSTYDYAVQLDRQVHAVHCSFIPGAPASTDGDNPCKAALFSAYSALFRATYWGGVPISLFALGAFCFFAAFALYLLLAGTRASKWAWPFLFVSSLCPLVASIVMFLISVTHLHTLCKLCVGIYVSSIALTVSALVGARADRLARQDLAMAPTEPARDLGRHPRLRSWALPVIWTGCLGLAALLPALVYAGALPDYRPLLEKCGKLPATADRRGVLKIPTANPVRPVLLFEDPLCTSCKAFHARLIDEGIYDRLDVTLALFPLDSECNWMLDRPLHPGACIVSRAVICASPTHKARDVLEWSYDDQEELQELAKQGERALTAKIGERWGSELAACVSSKAAVAQLNQQLHFAANVHIPVSTPQMFLGEQRICDEDTDLGLKYTMAQLAPEVLR
jgi:uncharacterized membrane protein